MFSAANCHVLWHFIAVYDDGKIKTMGRFENAPWKCLYMKRRSIHKDTPPLFSY